jgi:hypothetical protein
MANTVAAAKAPVVCPEGNDEGVLLPFLFQFSSFLNL